LEELIYTSGLPTASTNYETKEVERKKEEERKEVERKKEENDTLFLFLFLFYLGLTQANDRVPMETTQKNEGERNTSSSLKSSTVSKHGHLNERRSQFNTLT